MQVNIYTGATYPETLEYTLENPTSLPSGNDELTQFNAPTDTTLAADTIYWLAVERTAGEFTVARTSSNEQTGRRAFGIGDSSRQRATGDWSAATSSNRHLMFAVIGTAAEGDTTPPSLVAADSKVPASGTQIILTFDEDIDETPANLPPVSAFFVFGVYVDGNGYTQQDTFTVASIGVDPDRNDRIILNLAAGEQIPAGHTVDVTYTDPSADNDTAAIQDLAGNDAPTKSYLINNESTLDLKAPSLDVANSMVPASGAQVFLTFDEDIDETTANLPPVNAFTLTADGVTLTIASIGVDPDRNDRIVLNLAAGQQIYIAQVVTASYAAPHDRRRCGGHPGHVRQRRSVVRRRANPQRVEHTGPGG